MKPGMKIKLPYFICGEIISWDEFEVEEFRHCLGVFISKEHRIANQFTPLCELYERGPESKEGYISNHGEYYTNPVQLWIDLG